MRHAKKQEGKRHAKADRHAKSRKNNSRNVKATCRHKDRKSTPEQ
jgi:hypothetical protein